MKHKIVSTIFIACTSCLMADVTIPALSQWLTSKRLITLDERGGNFAINGDVKTRFFATNEVKNGINQRGNNSANPDIPFDDYHVETNVLFDYRTDFTWLTTRLKYNNRAGIINGTTHRIVLDRALLGFRILDGEYYTIDFEFGRRRLNYTFDSRVQFASLMDGILIKYNQISEFFGDFYLYAGPFLINERINQYGYVGEAGLLNMFNTGVYTKLSFIDWDTKRFDNPTEADIFRFRNIQWIMGYKFVPGRFNKVITVYGAFVNNVSAKPVEQTHFEKQNWAWYTGASVGSIREKGDWAFDWVYQWVQPQSIPTFDMDGIGRGNADNSGFYTVNADGTGGLTTAANATGNTNFKGWQFQLLYLISKTLTLSQTFQMTNTLSKDIGPNISLRRYQLEFIYAF